MYPDFKPFLFYTENANNKVIIIKLRKNVALSFKEAQINGKICKINVQLMVNIFVCNYFSLVKLQNIYT